MSTLILLIVGLLIIIVSWNKVIFPLRLKQIQQIPANICQYCLIDIRDFISAHNQPMTGAKNIPLSYLSREMKINELCDKDIVIVTDDHRGAKLAAKIINKKLKKPVYYITI